MTTTTEVKIPPCGVCGHEGDLFVLIDGKPCMGCIKARHRAAITGKCSCGNRRIPSPELKIGSRRWIACDRCLGTIKQLS